MDSITHIVLGACAGEAIAGKKLGKKAMLWGAVSNNIPDIDVISGFWLKPPESLLAHRGFTHSFLFALIVTAALALVMRRTKPDLSYSGWLRLIGVNVFLHLLIDAFTVYGTGWLEPFSHVRVSFNLLFVADPFFTFPLLVMSIVLLILKRASSIRNRVAWTGIALSCFYCGYAGFHKIKMDDIVSASIRKNNIHCLSYMTTPTPLNNFLWYVVARTDSGAFIGNYSVFDHEREIRFHYFPSNDYLLADSKSDEVVKKLIRFSRGYYRVENFVDTLVFDDLRFGQVGGWENNDAPFVFRFTLKENFDNSLVIQGGRIKASRSDAFRELVDRIKGR